MPSTPLPSFPWSGIAPGSAGPYSAAQFATFIAGLYNRLGNSEQGVLAWSGGIPAASLGLLQGFGFDVSAQAVPNMSVNVNSGTASINGTWVTGGAAYNSTIASNVSGFTRIDTVVLHLDTTAQTVVIQVNQGTPNSNPVPPALNQSGVTVYEIPLADITVINAASSITQANIQPRQQPTNAPDGVYMTVLNNSGGTLQSGDVVVWDTSGQQRVKLSSTVNDPTVAGVMVGRTSNLKFGMMLVKGVGWIHVNGAVSNGQALIQSSTAAQAAPANINTNRFAFAYAMSAVAGAGLMPAYIDASQIVQNMGTAIYNYLFSRPNTQIKRNNGANYTTSSTSFVDVDSSNLSITMNNDGTKVLVLVQLPAVSTSGNPTVAFDITVNGSRWGGISGLAASQIASSLVFPISIAVVVTGLTPGSNTFRIQWKVTAGSATINANGDFVSFSVQDISG